MGVCGPGEIVAGIVLLQNQLGMIMKQESLKNVKYQIKWQNIQTENKELFNFHLITTKVSLNNNKIVFSGSFFQKKIVFLQIRVQLKCVQIEKQY